MKIIYTGISNSRDVLKNQFHSEAVKYWLSVKAVGYMTIDRQVYHAQLVTYDEDLLTSHLNALL